MHLFPEILSSYGASGPVSWTSEAMITNMIVLLCFSALFPMLMGTEEVKSDCFLSTDCSDVYSSGENVSGVYTITTIDGPLQVYCEMVSGRQNDQGPWMVILRRMNGEVNFFRPWESYKWGFGNKAGEYWLGLEILHQLTRRYRYKLRVDVEDFEGKKAYAQYESFSVGSEADGYKLQVSGFVVGRAGLEILYQLTRRYRYKLRVDFEDFEGKKAYALYESFSVGSEADGYKLQVSGFVDGGAGDSLSYHNRMNFSTFDKDQDLSGENCALKYYQGGFWYNSCYRTNPTGNCLWEKDNRITDTGATWYTWKKTWYSLKSITMKIGRVK